MKDLSARETQILGLASAGLLDKNIAAELDISPNTLRTYWRRIRQKCGNLPRGALTAAFVRGELPISEDTSMAAPGGEALLSEIDDPEVLRKSAVYFATELQRVSESFVRTERVCRVFVAYVHDHTPYSTPEELAYAVCRIMVEEGEYVMAWVGRVEHDARKTISVVSSYGDRHGYLKDIEISWDENSLGRGPGGIAVRTNKSQVNQDFLANPHMLPWRDRAIASGFQSSIALPLRKDGMVFALLSAYAEEPDAFGSHERMMLEELAEDLATRWVTQFGVTD